MSHEPSEHEIQAWVAAVQSRTSRTPRTTNRTRMAAFRRSACKRDLKPHCAEGRCGWWKCTNANCAAQVYDVVRGVCDGEKTGG